MMGEKTGSGLSEDCSRQSIIHVGSGTLSPDGSLLLLQSGRKCRHWTRPDKTRVTSRIRNENQGHNVIITKIQNISVSLSPTTTTYSRPDIFTYVFHLSTPDPTNHHSDPGNCSLYLFLIVLMKTRN